mmetsp:Transcript_20126/g.30836  ORF Transcript_20126/g.30836 Transcript_20126/m.30836 type:complete len:419 (-) Transcript_20126:68-1324(-)
MKAIIIPNLLFLSLLHPSDSLLQQRHDQRVSVRAAHFLYVSARAPAESSSTKAQILVDVPATSTIDNIREWRRFAPNGQSKGGEPSDAYLEFGRIWYERLIQLQNFQAEHGHCNVPELYEGNPQLGNWVHNQRKEFQKRMSGESSSITDERVEALDDIGFVWGIFKSPKVDWYDRFDALVAYRKEHGDCNVPSNYVNDPALARWVKQIRIQYKNFGTKTKKTAPTRRSLLTKERIEALEEIGFVWSIYDQMWEDRLRELVAYRDQHGHCKVPQSWKESPELGSWVKAQRDERTKYDGAKKSSLTKERIRILNEIGFVWKLRTSWEDRYAGLLEYKRVHGDCKVPKNFTDDPGLGKWVDRQRQNYRAMKRGKKANNTKITSERINKLESIGFVWNIREEKPEGTRESADVQGMIETINE